MKGERGRLVGETTGERRCEAGWITERTRS